MISRSVIALALLALSPIALFSACFVNDRADAAHPVPVFDAAPPETMPSDAPTSRRHTFEDAVKDASVISNRSDAEIKSDIESGLAKNSTLAGEAKVAVTVEAGVVTLKGSVRDMDARDSVENIVRHTPGVVKLDDRIIPIDPHPRAMDPGPTGY